VVNPPTRKGGKIKKVNFTGQRKFPRTFLPKGERNRRIQNGRNFRSERGDGYP